MATFLRRLGVRLLPISARRQIVRYSRWPPVGLVRFGTLRRLRPISPTWGSERGQPVDRYYIERFLAGQAADVRGRVLEIGNDRYTRIFGGARVRQSDVLHVAEPGPGVTIIASLTDAPEIADDSYDCIILTQTLQAIFDVPAAVRTVGRILKPGGVVLATVPGISKISRYDMDRWGYFWSFTTASVRRIFEGVFAAGDVEIQAFGNVLAATAFLYGLASEELRRRELDSVDPDYELLITIRAVKGLEKR
jgi:SAM-dependent methyltransferase